MKEFGFLNYLVLITVCLLMTLAGLYLLVNFKTLFRRSIRNELLRQNILAWMAIFCFIIATAPMNSYFFQTLKNEGILSTIIGEMIATTVNSLFVFNIVRAVSRSRWIRKRSFSKQRVIVFLTIIIACVAFNVPMNYVGSNYKPDTVKFYVLISVYMAGITGMVYVLMTIIEADRSRKLHEKELELSRLNELRIKAELDVLHAKINPHFLYNALNSIADLSVTDGKKARQMTIALADLFRYSINYSGNNYSTVDEEVAMTEVYLQIEKIRFEDQLNYAITVEEGAGQYLVPRFILQSLTENAVKHGLKATGTMTEIKLEVKRNPAGLIICIADNGPAFPNELIPGYGVKSVFDKMDLLFTDNYEIFFRNQPRKEVSIIIPKPLKNEPVV